MVPPRDSIGICLDTKPEPSENANVIVPNMRAAGDQATIAPSARADARVTLPGDKSISHRYAMLAALADAVRRAGNEVVITGSGPNRLRAPSRPLDAVNSGTTMRLMSGILAGQPFRSSFTGDASLQRRPMRRIIDPLQQMGARIDSENGFPPLTIHGAPLRAIAFRPAAASAQIKSCVLLAGLYAEGTTLVEEPIPTRDHTERALETFGVRVTRAVGRVGVQGGQVLRPCELSVPGDISGAAFW